MQSERNQLVLGEQAGLLWTWWKGDPLPLLPDLPKFSVEFTDNPRTLSNLLRLPLRNITRPLERGHNAYIAYIAGKPVGYGWSAINAVAFGSPSVPFHVPAANRYLYFFVTLLPWRGLGVYPRLLQTIIQRESAEHDRFWIIHQHSNIPSQRGIAKAGFRIACKVYHLPTGGLGLVAAEEVATARAGADLLGLPLIEQIQPPQLDRTRSQD